MLSLPAGVRLFVATEPTDMRKSFDGLSNLVIGAFDKNPLAGDLFVFINRRGDQLRLLFRDSDGYCILAKRLEVGTFRRVSGPNVETHVEIEARDLAMLLAGVETQNVKRRKRYKAPSASAG